MEFIINYWVISPNVLNSPAEPVEDFIELISKNHVALIGWGEDNEFGYKFKNLIKINDLIIIAQGANFQKRNFFAGLVNSEAYKYKYEGNEKNYTLQAIRLKNFVNISDKNISWNNYCAYGEAKRIPALYKLKSNNPNDKKVINEVLSYINNGGKMTEYIELLKSNKNLILTGAPGTGKTHLAKQIANEIIKGDTNKNTNDIINNYYKAHKNELEEYFNKCEILRQEFIKKFPKEELKSISIEDYSIGGKNAQGKPLKNSFCYWVEFQLKNSGVFACGTADSYLLYYDKNGEIKNTTKNKNDDELIKEIGEAIYKMATENEYNGDLKFKGDKTTIKFAMKIYNSYNPYYYFPIFSSDYMNNICEIFNIEKDKNPYKQNLNIKEYFENNFKDIKPVIIKEILIRNFDLKNGIVNKNNNGISLEGKIGFVQFHPSYDYTDFVEGLRPKNDNGNIVFERKDGVFKEFCKEALNNQSSNFVFIIDEINRGEISKIFGELFFSVDSGYRGEKGKVLTQYANLIEDGDEFKDGFYIPENVFIIGTMNDIDRSVESMDFAMRRRFAWKEIKAENTQETILSDLGNLKDETIKRMNNLNNVIRDKETNLSEAYCIGAAYFKKIKDYKGDFDKLWDNHLNVLLFEYTRGMSNQKEIMIKLKAAYN